MQLRNIPVLGLLLFFNLQMFRAYPVYNELMTNDDIDLLKMLLHRLEESIPELNKVERVPNDLLDNENVDETAVVEEGQQQAGLDEAAVRDFLSARNLKTTRNDSSKRSSGCFGRRMDRIGSMSSLGCNTVGRYSPKRR